MLDPTYQASPIKLVRVRSSKAEVEQRRTALFDIVAGMKPMTFRQVFYQATVRGIVDKTEAGYSKVQTDLALMRREGFTYKGDALRLPYNWLADNTRWQRAPQTFSSVQQALNDTARLYRKSLWENAEAYVEIWLEKDALSGVVYPVTSMFDVPLMVARGYASLSFLHSAAEAMNEMSVPVYVYHLGDFDPSGVNAGEKIEQTLKELAPDADITFERIGVTPAQIEAWHLPSRPTKTSDSRAKGFGDISVELDAIEPSLLRAVVQDAIERHLPPEQYEVLKLAEASERQLIGGLVAMATRGGAA